MDYNPPDEDNTVIHNRKELTGYYGKNWSGLERMVYKSTSCGAWITPVIGGVRAGSIVEGVDYDTDTHTLRYPFTIDDFWAMLTEIEMEADEIWKDTHGCSGCRKLAKVPKNERYCPIHQECKKCKGEGIII